MTPRITHLPTAEDIRVDTDEGEFILVIDHDLGTWTVNIHGIVLDFYRTVQRDIRPVLEDTLEEKT